VVDSRTGAKSQVPFMLRIAKVFADPLRLKILTELNMRTMSPKQFFEEFGGGSLSRVSRHFEVLVEYGWLRLVGTKSGGKRRGAVEHFYRATGPAVFDNETWAGLPRSMRGLFTWKTFEQFAERVKEATEADTIDARDDRHFTWTPVLVDQVGWENVIARVDALFEFLFEELARARLRMAESGEEPIPMTVALAAFESPKDSVRAP
jgi:DNA-binding transcriptional ArsR family regulator